MANSQKAAKTSERYDKRIHVAMPVRVTWWDEQKQPHIELACTLDISSHGSRLFGLQGIQRSGQVIAIERSRNRVLCRIVWVGETNTDRRGQVGVRAIEVDRTLWDAELREVGERFDPLPKDLPPGAGGHKRRAIRLNSDAAVHVSRLTDDESNPEPLLTGKLANVSEVGCFISGPSSLPRGAGVQVVISLPHYELSLRGQVRSVTGNGMGIEFRQIRKGDRQLLKYWLRQLSMPMDEMVLEVS
jgi:hypothetical protein